MSSALQKMWLRVLIDAAVGAVLLVLLVTVAIWDHSGAEAAPPSIDLVFVLDDGSAMSEAVDAMKDNCLAQAKSVNSNGAACRYAVIPFGNAQQVRSIALTDEFTEFEDQLKSTPEDADGHPADTVADALNRALAMDFGDNADVLIYIVTNTSIEGDTAIDAIAQRMQERQIRAVVQADVSEQEFYRPLYRNGGRFFSMAGEDLTEAEYVDAAKKDNTRVVNLLTRKNAEEKAEARINVRGLYTEFAGKSVIADSAKDEFGNPSGSQYDLGRDGAFEGLQIAVLSLHKFDFGMPQKALEVKGFSIHLWGGTLPEVSEFERVLEESSQLWIISDCSANPRLSEVYLNVITEFFESGRGVYIWGDNRPCYADANYVANALLGASLEGDSPGDQTVGRKTADSRSGVVEDHLISTGIESIYEGITISTVVGDQDLQPLVYGSNGQVVVGAYGREGKRLVLDGGFTRLFYKWDTAGTGRYVQNAAAWLVNYERFGDAIFEK